MKKVIAFVKFVLVFSVPSLITYGVLESIITGRAMINLYVSVIILISMFYIFKFSVKIYESL
jgi:hypothetical protein